MRDPRDTDLGMQQGEVIWYSKEKGYGFLLADDGRAVFFHWSGIGKDCDPTQIREGVEVTFRLWKQNGEPQRGNGLKATQVRPV